MIYMSQSRRITHLVDDGNVHLEQNDCLSARFSLLYSQKLETSQTQRRIAAIHRCENGSLASIYTIST